MIPSRALFSVTCVALTALLSMLASINTASAGPDVRKAYSTYKTSCLALEIEKYKFLQTVELLEKERLKFSTNCNTPTYYLDDHCRLVADMLGVYNAGAEYHGRNILRGEAACQKAKRNYITALTELVTEAVLTGPEPDPNAASPTRRRSTGTVKKSPNRTRKPPVRRKSTVKKNRRRPPTRHRTTNDTRAAEFIGGLILFGIQQGITSGSKRGGRGPGYIP